MIILSNKSYFGTDTVVYDIHRDTEDIVSDGTIACTFSDKGSMIAIELYGPCWEKGPHHYQDEIIDVLKFAEPNVGSIIYLTVAKCNR